MGTTRLVTAAAVLLALAAPALAQGGRGPGSRQPSDGGAGGRDGVSQVGGAVPRHDMRPEPSAPPRSTLWSENASTPRSPFARGLVGGGLLTPRPGIDLFRAAPGTFAAGPGRTPGVRSSSHPARPLGRGRSDGWRRNGTGAVIYPLVGGIYPLVGGIYAQPYGYWPYAELGTVGPAPELTAPAAPTGFLHLAVTPRRAEVYVDGIYEGLVDDFGGSGERALPSGLHRVRLETEGYEPVEFDVRIPDNDTITLRRDLYPRSELPPPVAAPAPAAGPAPAPKTIYVIPRCYLGDTLPRADDLPAGCSIANLRTLPGSP